MTQDVDVGILLYEGFEEMSAIVPHAVWDAAAVTGGLSVTLYSLVPAETITAGSGLELAPDDVLIGTPDIVFVPDGYRSSVTESGAAVPDDTYLERVQSLADESATIVAIGSGVLGLGQAGVLDGRSATTHPEYRANLGDTDAVVMDADIVADGNVITGFGPGIASDLAQYVVNRECGDEVLNSLDERFQSEQKASVHETEPE